MDIYLSYKDINFNNKFIDTNWEPIEEHKKQIQINLLKLNFHILKLYYKNIYLVTDTETLPFVDGLEWSNIYTLLDIIPEQYLNAVPALSKLYAYNFAAKQKKPFIHIDNDLFILDKFNLEVENSQAIAEDERPIDMHFIAWSSILKEYCNNLNFFLKTYYNCGIIGGQNYSFFEKYSSSAIELILNEKNKNFFLESNHFSRLDKSILSEQIHYAFCIKKFNVPINIINKNYLNNSTLKYNYIHFIGPQKYIIFKNKIFDFDNPLEFLKSFYISE